MTMQSQFIKLPGEWVVVSQDGLESTETYPATFWIARDEIGSVIEHRNAQTGELSNSMIYTLSGQTFFCLLPAVAVIALIDQYDKKALQFNIFHPFN